jgi:tRNA(Glu) U13 pseudouridine synthase TruD
MQCPICEGETFAACEYVGRGVRAPARECLRCRAVVLDENAADSDEARESVRIAKAVRRHVAAGGGRRSA